MKVSFVVPVFKAEKTLKRCLESILDQDYKDIEIFCVLDGKNGGCEKIIKKLQKDRNDGSKLGYKVIPHGGVQKARNEGFKHVNGDVVSFWDSDCYAEPAMVRVWVMHFERFKDIDFVYSGYQFISNDKNVQPLAYPSEAFNPWLLTCYNYISTMFPIRKKVLDTLSPVWDEKIESLQDWDLWLTLVHDKKCKGYWIEGTGFKTEFPHKKSISAIGCSEENWLKRRNIVREKHGITGRDVVITSHNHVWRAFDVAQFVGGDFIYMPSEKKHEYKMIYKIGFYGEEREVLGRVFRNAPKDCIKVIHWMGDDIESMGDLPFRGVKALVDVLNLTVDYHFCENEFGRKQLVDLGIKEPKIVPLPMDIHEVKTPKKFTVYYEHDKSAMNFVLSLKKALPDLELKSPNEANLNDYACYVSMTDGGHPTETLKQFLTAGKWVVTNYQLPYSNYVSIGSDGDTSKFKSTVIRKIRECQKKWKAGEKNLKAMDYWRKVVNKDKFTEEIKTLKKRAICLKSAL